MKSWKQALQDSLVSGSVASLSSTAALAVRGRQETGSAYAPTNAISHWLWGDSAARHDKPSLRHTLVGYAIHHASAVLWAAVYERFFGKQQTAYTGKLAATAAAAAQVKNVVSHDANREAAKALLGGAAIAATACFVDYKLTPHRLQPGYEMRLSGRSLFMVYAAFGVGLAASQIIAGYRR